MDELAGISQVKVPENLASLRQLDIRFTRSIEKENGMHVIAERMRQLSDAQD